MTCELVDATLATSPVRLTKVLLENLAAWVTRKDINPLHLRWALEACEALARELNDFIFRDFNARCFHDDGKCSLAPLFVRNSDD